jgi:MFS family permease
VDIKNRISGTRDRWLLFSPRFGPLFATQFLGAFNDNFFKNALIVLFTFILVSSPGETLILVNLASALFILPFFLFSPLAGQLADKYEKSGLIRRIKQGEIVIMTMAAFALWSESVYAMLLVLFLLGMQSTFFGPTKYSLLPQHLGREELLDGNAYVECGTFLAILLGTLCGGWLAADRLTIDWLAYGGVVIAIIGWFASMGIPEAPSTIPNLKLDWNLYRGITGLLAQAKQAGMDRLIAYISWFWLLGALFLTQLAPWADEMLKTDGRLATLLIAIFSIGIAVGSIWCAHLAQRFASLKIALAGGSGMSVFAIWMALIPEQAVGFESIAALPQSLAGWSVITSLGGLSICAGLYTVPLYTLLQMESPEDVRSRVIAALNVTNSFYILAGSIAAMVLLSLIGISISMLFGLLGLINVGVMIMLWAYVVRRLIDD